MKRNEKNIITSDDITVLGKNSGKTLDEVLERLLDESDGLKSNVKWLYKYGGVGGNGGGGGPTITNKWSAICSLGTKLIPETKETSTGVKSILFPSAGTYNLYIHINNPGGDTYSVEYSYNGGKSTGKATLNHENRCTCNIGLNLIENNTIHISIMNGNLLEKVFDAVHIVNAYSIQSYLVDDTGQKYETYSESGIEKYNLFIDDVKQRGIKFVTKYNSAVNVPVTYYYTKFKSSKEERKTGLFREGLHEETLLEVNAIDNLESMTDADAAPYVFLMKINIDNTEISSNISADFLPNDLYLKIIPAESDLILYTNNAISDHLKVITGNKTFTITPYNGKSGGSGKVNVTYFINGVLVVDSSTSVAAQDSILPGKAFLKTLIFSKEGWNEIIFKASFGDIYKEFTYYIFTEKPSNTIDWFNSTKSVFSSAFYRYGDCTLNLVKLTKNGSLINPNTYIIKNANDSVLSETILSSESILKQELMINIGIQYNYINDESKEIIEIPTTDSSDTNSIHIYLNKILVGASKPQGIFFLEEEEKYDINNKNNYHLITIARKYIRTTGISTHLYELSFYIDGVLLANTVQHVLPSTYNKFIIKNGNYSINLLDITYLNNNAITETDVVQYWYAYLTRLLQNFEDIDQKINLLNIFSNFNLEHINNSQQELLTGHVSIIESTLLNLIQNIKVPVLCIEYEPSANKDSQGNSMLFLTPPSRNASDGWSDKSYRSDSKDSLKLTIGLKWSNGSGTANTTLLTIDTSSILTPDGQQRSAIFTLDIQGSTTRSYKGKNYTLGMEFTDSSDLSYIPVFTPWFDINDRNSFLPENSFTLKADIVDSSHTNNTCMGKFINENTNQFDDAKQVLSIYSGHIKNCLEGFPCLMFVHSTGDVNYYYLGIYNFNLGRTSNFNLGYNDLRALPELSSSTDKNFHIYSVAKTSTGSLIGSDIKQGLITAEIDGNAAWYDFSQYDESILFLLPNRPNDKGFMFDEIISGKDTSGTTSQYTKSAISNFVKRVSRSGGYIFDKIEKGFFDDIGSDYTVLPGFVPNSRKQYKRIKDNDEETFEVINDKSFLPGSPLDFTPDDLINFVYSHSENDRENVAPYGNYRSIVEYYTICMAFGLLDSVLKNLNIKSWNEGNTFYLAFYDMDTCLGINNDGDDVSYYAFSDYWQNTSGNIIGYDENQVPIILAPPITVYRDYAPNTGDQNNLYDAPSSYMFAIAKYAKSVIQYYNLNSSESNISIDTLLTPQNLWALWRSVQGSLKNSKYFIDLYYNGYMNGINELMFNYNFRAKYFKESNTTTYDEESSRFRGRSIGYLKDWLNKRFHILDAYFNLAGNSEIYISDGINYDKTNKNGLNYDPNYQIVYEQYPVGLITYSDDVNINKSIFGEKGSVSGDIDIVVLAPDYTPVIAIVGRSMYRYLLEESSNKYNIKITNTGTNKVVFGGSSMWTYIESIDTLAEGNVFIESDKLLVLNGKRGTVNSWDLKMPALLEIHLNSSDYTGNLIFDRESNFYNLTTIDISNSKINLELDNQVVREINLAYVNCGKVDILNCHFIENISFNNSQIGECYINEVEYLGQGLTLTLNRNSIRTLNLSAKTSLNLNLKIENDSDLTTLIVSGFKNVTINNCPKLTSITSNGLNLTKLDVNNCLLLSTVSLNVTNCSYIRINEGALNELKLKTSNNSFEAITLLLIPKSTINKIHYYRIYNGVESEINTSSDNIINLKPLVNLDNLDLSYNNIIQYIIFKNDFDNPVPIRNSFIGCTELLRIYGCIKIVNTEETFRNLNKFSIHGNSLSTKWKNYDKTKSVQIDGTNYSIVLTPLLLLSNETENLTHSLIITNYDLITKRMLFLDGDNVTNIFFDSLPTGSFTYFLSDTDITLFDVYYMLNSFGLSSVSKDMSVNNGSFCGLKSMFNYSDGNQFNRYTFYKCSRIVLFSGGTLMIFNTSTTLWYSPTISQVSGKDDGLFSPLVNLRLIHGFSGNAYISRYVFRRNNLAEKYPLSGNSFVIYYLPIAFIYDDIDLYKVLSLVPTMYEGRNILLDYLEKLGNMTDIFKQTKLTEIISSFSMSVINYSTLTIPNTIKSIIGAFSNSYGFGTFDWKTVFGDSNYNTLTEITNSFILSDYLGESRVKFELSEDMFSKMKNLLYLGYRYYSNSIGGAVNSDASSVDYNASYGFRGGGFDKVLSNGTFPYNITSNIKNIINFVGLFSELYRYSPAPNITVDFPGTMFYNTPYLLDISDLFANTNLILNLTSEGFIRCPNLRSVSRLFYMDVSSTYDESVTRMLQNISIPYKFFSLGEESKIEIFYGTNDINVMNADILYLESNHTEGTEFSGLPVTVRRLNPIKNIMYGSLCFYGLDKLIPYKMDSSFELGSYETTLYPNNNYIPFKYYKIGQNGAWNVRPDDSPKYTRRFDISKIYDGDPTHLMSGNNDVYCEDSDNVRIYGTENNEDTKKNKTSVNYFCPPDLLNSFVNSNNININGMFKWCGCGGSDIYGPRKRSDALIYSNMYGRICPYLFNTVDLIQYLVEFFENCKGINSYVVGTTAYLIPPKLFEKTKNITRLAKTFAGMYFDTTNYSFLVYLKNSLDIRGIFSMCFYKDNSAIANVFLYNTLSNVSGAFCIREVNLLNDLNYTYLSASDAAGGGVSVRVARSDILEEPTTCTFDKNITMSINSSRNIIKKDTYFVYYGVDEGVNNNINHNKVTNETVLELNNNYNLHN